MMHRQLLTILTISWFCTATALQGQEISSADADAFTATEIPDSVWQRMQGRSYQPNPDISRSDLRYLRVLHYDAKGQTCRGELVCNRMIAQKLLFIFRELYRQHYPIERMRLPDEYEADDDRQMRDNNTSCFCYRRIAGSKRLSRHALGLAIDINPLYNPQVTRRADGTLRTQPATATPYTDRTKSFPYKIVQGDLCHRLFLHQGFIWGGSWKSTQDYQHFEFKNKL